MKLILLLFLAVPVTPLIYAPDVDLRIYIYAAEIYLPLYGEHAHNLICKTKLSSSINTLEKYGSSVFKHIDSKYHPLLLKCWHETTGIEYPCSREEFVTFYCNNTSPWILKNLAEHCFMSSWKKKVSFTNLRWFSLYDKIQFALDDEDWEGVGSEMESVAHDPDYYSDQRCNNITNENEKTDCAYENHVRKICVENDTKLLQEEIHQHKCIERAAPTRMEIVKFCWNIIIKKPYPVNDEEWKDLTCNTVFTLAKRKLMLTCISYKMERDNSNVSTIIRAHCNDCYFPLENEEDDRGYHADNGLPEEDGFHYLDKLIQLKEDYKPVCEDKDTEKTENFLKRHELKCLKDSVQTPLGLKVLAYCWNRSFGNKNVSFPSEQRDWLSFACANNTIKVLRSGIEIVNCFKNIVYPGESVFNYIDDPPITSVEGEISTRCHRIAFGKDSDVKSDVGDKSKSK